MIRGVLVIDSAMRRASASVWYGRSVWQRVVVLVLLGVALEDRPKIRQTLLFPRRTRGARSVHHKASCCRPVTSSYTWQWFGGRLFNTVQNETEQ